jgi:hypothetical protein
VNGTFTGCDYLRAAVTEKSEDKETREGSSPLLDRAEQGDEDNE